MSVSEIVIYLLVVGAFLAFGWMFTGSHGGGPDSWDKDPGWKRLPWVYRASWGFVTLFEDSFGSMLAEWFPNRARRQAENAVTAAVPLTANRVLATTLVFGASGVFLGVAVGVSVALSNPSVGLPLAVALAALFGLVGWFWPTQDLAHAAEIRQRQITRELPFAIDLVSSAMRSGLEFGAALRYFTSLKTRTPLEEEFSRLLADVTLGKSFADGLKEMASRVRLEAFSSFVGVVSYGMEIGAPIAQSLKMHGADLRRERFNLAERQAAKAPAKMILPLVIFIMPAVFIIVLTPFIMRLKGAF